MPYNSLFIEKTTEAASLILKHFGGEINYMKLVKLLYLVDRIAFKRWEQPITYDQYSSLPKGPLGSSTLDLVKENFLKPNYWCQYITRVGKNVRIINNYPPIKKLCDAEIELINEILIELGHLNQYQLAELSEKLPEWKDPQGSSKPIDLHFYLSCLGFNEKEAERIEYDIQQDALLEDIFRE